MCIFFIGGESEDVISIEELSGTKFGQRWAKVYFIRGLVDLPFHNLPSTHFQFTGSSQRAYYNQHT